MKEHSRALSPGQSSNGKSMQMADHAKSMAGRASGGEGRGEGVGAGLKSST